MVGKHIIAVVCLASLSVVLAKAPPQQSGNSSAILLQGFHWNSSGYKSPNWYSTLSSSVDDLADLGITHVWFPPPSDAGASQGYLPRQLNNLNSSYGSADDLASVIQALKKKNITAVVDVVVNHRVGTTDWADFTDPEWSLKSIVSDDECTCGLGNPDTGYGFDGGRDVDHTNVDEVQTGIKTWLNDVLKPVGFNGLRFDFVKGFSPEYFGLYADSFDGDFCVGELWDYFNPDDMNPHRQQIMDWIDGTGGSCGAFDFTTKGILNDALPNGNYFRLKDSEGKPQGVIGTNPSMAVTFVDNHDTGPAESCGTGQSLWSIPCDKVLEAYAYILTHPGIPTIFYPHIFDWNHKSALADLVKVRKEAGITSTSEVSISEAAQGLYAAIVSGNNKQVAVKIGPNDWTPGDDWNLEATGIGYYVWTK